MRTLNVRLAATCVLVVVVLSGGVHLLHGYQVHKKADQLKKASERAEEEKNFEEAIRHLESYVQLVPSDGEAKLQLGLLYAKSPGHAMAAFERLEEFLRTSDLPEYKGVFKPEDLHDARRKLADEAMKIGRMLDAETHLRLLLKETPEDPELLDLYGQVLIVNNKDDEACKQFVRAIDIAPTQIGSYVRLATVLRSREQKKDEAEKVMLDMVHHKVKDKDGKEVEVNAKSVSALRNYSDWLREEGHYDEALVQAKQILQLAPDDAGGLLSAGICYLSKGDSKTAEEYLTRGIKADKNDRAMYQVLAQAKVNQGHKSEAIAVLRQGMEATKGTGGYGDILYDLCNMYMADAKIPEAEKCLQELRDLRIPPRDAPFSPTLVTFLEARMALLKHQWSEAKAILIKVLPKLHGGPNERGAPGLEKLAYCYLAQCYQQEGDVDNQMINLTAATKIDPYFHPARAGLAECFMSRGMFDDAAEQYDIMVRGPHPEPDVAPSLCRILIMQRLREDKGKRDWRRIDEALDSFQAQAQSKSESKNEVIPNLTVLKAEVLLAKDRPQDAEQLLKDCTAKYGKSAESWLGLINLAMHEAGKETDAEKKERKWKEAADDIDQAQRNLGDSSIIRVLRASCAVRRKDPQAVALLKKYSEGADKMSAVGKIHLWSNFGALSVQANDFALARHYFRLIAENEPTNIRIRYLVCDLNLQAYEKGQTADLQELDQMLGEIVHLDGHDPFWLYCKAVRTLVASKKTDPQMLLEARGDLLEAMKARKDWAAPVVLAGKICELQDEPDQALDFYNRAVFSMGERDSDVIRRTVQLLVPRGQVDKARQLFDYLEKQKSSVLGEMNDQRVQVLVVTGDIDEAEKEVAKSVASDSTNYKDYLRQGQMYSYLARRLKFKALTMVREANNDPTVTESAQKLEGQMLQVAQLAGEALLKARTLNPRADEVWLSLVQLLVELGQPEKARPFIDEAAASLTGDMAPVTVAKCCELVNQTERARASYEAAAKGAPENSHVLRQVAGFYLRTNKIELAAPLLVKIVALQTPATLNDACWARRMLAVAMKNMGDFEHLCQGMALLEENLHSKAASTDDKRARVDILIVDPRKEKTAEAIAAMEDLVQSTDATPSDYFALARLYLKKDDWNRYRETMHNVLGAKRVTIQPAHLAFYIKALLQKKELDEADIWLQKLEKTAPNNFDTMRFRAEYLFLREKYEDAGKLAMAFLENPNSQPKDRGIQNQSVAEVMEGFSDSLKSEGKRAEAKDFNDKAEQLFASLRNKSVSANGDIFYAAYLGRQKRIRECLEILDQCSEKCPPDALQFPAIDLIRSKAANDAQYEHLAKIVAAAVKRSDHPANLLSILAMLHGQLRQYDKGMADYREILSKEPKNFRAMNNLGLSLARSGQNLDEALKLVNDALAIAGPMAELLDSRALVYIARKEPEKALADLALAIQDDPTADRYFHQAWAYSLAGKKDEAAAAFTEALKKQLDPTNLDPREVADFERLRDGLASAN